MTELEDLKRSVTLLERAVRWTVLMFALATGIRFIHVLQKAPKYEEIFNGLLKGQSLPQSTQFFLNYHEALIGLTVFLLLIVCGLCFIPRFKLAGMMFAPVLVAAFGVGTLLATEAFIGPILGIIQMLT